MWIGTVIFSGREWLVPAGVFLAVVLIVLGWCYAGAATPRAVRWLGAFLKLLGVTALLLCLLEPLGSGQRVRPGANLFAVLADNSQGMQIKDRGDSISRGERLRALLSAGDDRWPLKLEEQFQVRRYFFDSRLQTTRDFRELNFEGRVSGIAGALRTVQERYRGRPLAGVLLLTDGNATDAASEVDWRGLPPVYPVVLGRDEPIKDIAVQTVAVSQTAFEDTPVTVQVEASATGYGGATVAAQLLALAGGRADASVSGSSSPRGAAGSGETVLQQVAQRVSDDSQALTFRFQFRPERPGVSFFQVRVAARDELGQFRDPKTSVEATLANNSRVVMVDRGQGALRVLYVGGRPNWEYKFLNRALAEDDQIQLVGLIRIARREPKFDFRGRPGEANNPLFRGFDRKTEETERYDQPVLIRLNTRDEVELRGGFPRLAEELYSYHAVIVDDLEAGFFAHDQMALLHKFVSERGGGFLMLGGQDSFQHGHYQGTPVADLLPVYLDRFEAAKPAAQLRLSLTREGWLQPWARLRSNESDERARLEQMPLFQVLNRVRALKPGASAVAAVTDAEGRSHPALAVQRFGHGRSAALLTGDLWRWGMHQQDLQTDLGKAWRQLVRWLVADVPDRITLQAEPDRDDPGQAVRLLVRARDRKFQPIDNATVTLQVRPVLAGDCTNSALGSASVTNTIRLTAEPVAGDRGVYQASFVSRETGGYIAEATVADAEGLEAGQAATGWSADPAAEEFRSLKPDRVFLEKIAQQTGGKLLAPEELERFVGELPRRQAPVMESWTYPLWHRPAVFLFALGCFVVEWGLRRWKGLA